MWTWTYQRVADVLGPNNTRIKAEQLPLSVRSVAQREIQACIFPTHGNISLIMKNEIKKRTKKLSELTGTKLQLD